MITSNGLKVGDQIVIAEKYVGGVYWNDAMDNYIGRTAEITQIRKGREGDYLVVILKGIGNWVWPPEALELADMEE